MDSFGSAYAPSATEDEQRRRRQLGMGGGAGGTGPSSPVQQAVQVLSLRLPHILGASAPIARSLLAGGLGRGGGPGAAPTTNELIQQLQRRQNTGPQAVERALSGGRLDRPTMPQLPGGLQLPNVQLPNVQLPTRPRPPEITMARPPMPMPRPPAVNIPAAPVAEPPPMTAEEARRRTLEGSGLYQQGYRTNPQGNLTMGGGALPPSYNNGYQSSNPYYGPGMVR